MHREDDDDLKTAAIQSLRDSGVLPGQRWRHNVTQTIYLIIAVGLFEPDLTPLVHYRDASDEYGVVWTRALNIFCGQVTSNSQLVPRFTRVE